jgi:hypothetical protein
MMILLAYRQTFFEKSEPFTFDDMNHWLNRRCYAPVESSRDALAYLSKDIPLFEKSTNGGINYFNILQRYVMDLENNLIEYMPAVRRFRDTCSNIAQHKHKHGKVA